MKDEKTPEEQFFYNIERGITKTPKFLELWKGTNQWIWCGEDNLYPQELIRLSLDSSSLHSALLRKKADMTAANGFKKEDLSGPALNFLANRFGEDTLDVIAYKTAMDLAIFSGYYLKIGWSKDRKSIARISHVPYEKVRIAKPVKGQDGKIEERKYYVSRDWTNYRRAENEPVVYSDFNALTADANPEQILFVKNYTAGAEYYALPNYTSSLNYIKLAYEISCFHLKSIQNNLNQGLVITMVGPVPPQQQRDADYKRLKDRYAGAEPSGDVMILYAQNKDLAPVITPMPNNASDERFKDLILSVNDNIKLGHGASNIIAGLETAGKLGSSTEVQEAYDAYQNTVINGMQKKIQDTFDRLASFNGIIEHFELNKYNVFNKIEATGGDSKVYDALNTLSPLVSNKVLESMTPDEIRGLVQLPSTTPVAAPVLNEDGTVNEEASAPAGPAVINEAIKGLSGREHQGLLRIIKQVTTGKLTREQAAVLLATGYGLSIDEVDSLLGKDETISI